MYIIMRYYIYFNFYHEMDRTKRRTATHRDDIEETEVLIKY